MGAKAWFAAYSNSNPRDILSRAPALNREESRALAIRMLPHADLDPMEDGELAFLNPDDDTMFVGVYGDLKIIAHSGFGLDYPSHINPGWHDPALGQNMYVHATHSVVDWFAFGLWQDGEMVRSLSLSPDHGIMENIGTPLPHEVPYWSSEHADQDDEDIEQQFPFHPIDLAEATLLHMLGFEFEGHPKNWVCDPYDMPICRFSIKPKAKKARTPAAPWWKIW